jgi:hypothetical protein
MRGVDEVARDASEPAGRMHVRGRRRCAASRGILHPHSEPLIGWSPLTMRPTVRSPQTQALPVEQPASGDAASKPIESVQHLLWHGHVEEAWERWASWFLDLDWIWMRKGSVAGEKLAAGITEFESYLRNHRESIPHLRRAVPTRGNHPHGVLGVDPRW